MWSAWLMPNAERTAHERYEKTSTLRSSRNLIMFIASPLHKPLDDYSTGPPICLEPELIPLLLMPDTEWNSNTSTTASYWTADNGVDKLATHQRSSTGFPCAYRRWPIGKYARGLQY